MMMECTWFDYLLNYARGSIATEALKAIEAAPFLRDVPEPCKAGLVDAIPDMNGWEVLKGLKHLNRRTRKKLWCSDKWAVHLFAGEREKKEIWHLERHGYAVLEYAARMGKIAAVIGGPPQGTFMISRYNVNGPRQLRTNEYPFGNWQGQSDADVYTVNRESQLLVRMIYLHALATAGRLTNNKDHAASREVGFMLEHPRDPRGYLAFGDPLYPGVVSFWRTSLWSEYALEAGLQTYSFDMVKMVCRWASARAISGVCVAYRAGGTGRRHSRVEHPSAFVMSSDLSGPVKVGSVDPDARGAFPRAFKYIFVAKLRVPQSFVEDGRGTWLHYDSGDLSVEEYNDEDDGLALVEQPEQVPPPAEEEERQEEDIEPAKKLDPEEDIDLAPPALVNLIFATGVKDDKAATVLEAIQDVVLYCQAMNIPVLRFHSDRGMEFRAKATQQWLKGQGIRVTTSEAGVHQTNGAAESTVRWVKQTMKGKSSSIRAGLHDPGPLEEGLEAEEPAGPHKRIRGKSSGAGDVVVLSKAMIFEDKQYQERAEEIVKNWSQEEAEEFVKEVCGQLPASENVYGMFRHGGKAGVTRATVERPWFAKLLLRMLRDKAPEAEFELRNGDTVHGRVVELKSQDGSTRLAKVQFEIEGEKVTLVQGKVDQATFNVEEHEGEYSDSELKHLRLRSAWVAELIENQALASQRMKALSTLINLRAARAETFNWEEEEALVVRRMKRLQKLRDATSAAIQKEIQSRATFVEETPLGAPSPTQHHDQTGGCRDRRPLGTGDASVGSGRPWQFPDPTEEWVLVKADVTKAHRRIKVLLQEWRYQVAQLGDEWWVNTVGTYGVASAQLYWGRMAAILLRLTYAVFPEVQFLPSRYFPVNTWLGFVIDPKGASDASASDDGSAYVGGWLFNVASPNKSEVFWFHYQVTPEDHPWVFDKGCPKKRIAALEMFGTLVLAHFLMEKAPAFIPNLRIPLVSDNQGNVYSLLNDKSKKMPTSVILMEILLQLHVHGMQLAPWHVKRDFNTWADELTHPDFHGFTPSLCLPVIPVLKHFSLIRSILVDRIFDDATDLTHGPVQGVRSLESAGHQGDKGDRGILKFSVVEVHLLRSPWLAELPGTSGHPTFGCVRRKLHPLQLLLPPCRTLIRLASKGPVVEAEAKRMGEPSEELNFEAVRGCGGIEVEAVRPAREAPEVAGTPRSPAGEGGAAWVSHSLTAGLRGSPETCRDVPVPQSEVHGIVGFGPAIAAPACEAEGFAERPTGAARRCRSSGKGSQPPTSLDPDALDALQCPKTGEISSGE
ncbi:hypothetical protein AK812_SmicGene29368 [Symbiodinium microadriaticum]|uniref:Integrase catalytic domain-containing protein n=1 Tax=Symbiodinium microadriaticum TaxID=2951 RepID=A0A1Q9D230_SYMMI|nr:hypothetical protein AK812_SmicGene29368 [Symbiodinium microadriaticum]